MGGPVVISEAFMRPLCDVLMPVGRKPVSSGFVVDLFLSYRAVKAWDDMIGLVSRMSAPLAQSVLVPEQLGLALNRAGRGDEAERVLLDRPAFRPPAASRAHSVQRVTSSTNREHPTAGVITASTSRDRWRHAWTGRRVAMERGTGCRAAATRPLLPGRLPGSA